MRTTADLREQVVGTHLPVSSFLPMTVLAHLYEQVNGFSLTYSYANMLYVRARVYACALSAGETPT